MFKRLLAIVVVALIAVLLYANARPDGFHIERSTTIKAPPEKVFAAIDDFKGWAGWSPWEKKDPKMQRTHSGAASGKGAVYAWTGNKDVGQGRMEVVESTPPSRLVIKLDFIQPFEAHNTAEFTLKPQGDATEVTWAMHGPQPFMAKLMGLFFSMDKLVGSDFETGLANLKTLAEK